MSESPPWTTDDWSGPGDFRKLWQQFEAIRNILADEAAFGIRDEAVSGWSGGEHAGHLALVTMRMARAVEAGLACPETSETPPALPDTTRDILERGEAPRGVAQAPDPVRPEGRERGELLETLDQAEALWRRLAQRQADIDGCPSRIEHPRLGFMTPREWLRLCAIHSAHHLEIVRDIRQGGVDS